MKKLFLLLLIFLCSCSKDIGERPYGGRSYISVSPNVIELGDGGGYLVVEISTVGNAGWRLDHCPDWCYIIPSIDPNLIMVAVKNNSHGYRVGEIQFATKDRDKYRGIEHEIRTGVLTVKQK